MAKIVPNQDFLDGGKRFKKGQSYKVSAKLSDYFRENGWLTSSPRVEQSTDVSLDVHSSAIGHAGKGP